MRYMHDRVNVCHVETLIHMNNVVSTVCDMHCKQNPFWSHILFCGHMPAVLSIKIMPPAASRVISKRLNV